MDSILGNDGRELMGDLPCPRANYFGKNWRSVVLHKRNLPGKSVYFNPT